MSTDLLDRVEVWRLFGGSKPINRIHALSRHSARPIPKPIHVGPGSSRWLRDECEAVLRRMAEARS